jgi:hypothetical protein
MIAPFWEIDDFCFASDWNSLFRIIPSTKASPRDDSLRASNSNSPHGNLVALNRGTANYLNFSVQKLKKLFFEKCNPLRPYFLPIWTALFVNVNASYYLGIERRSWIYNNRRWHQWILPVVCVENPAIPTKIASTWAWFQLRRTSNHLRTSLMLCYNLYLIREKITSSIARPPKSYSVPINIRYPVTFRIVDM